MSVLPVFAFTAGAAIAVQAAINAQLGVALKNTLLGTSVAFLCSFFLCALAVMFFTKQFPSMALVTSVPSYLWFGGVLRLRNLNIYKHRIQCFLSSVYRAFVLVTFSSIGNKSALLINR